MSVLGEGNDQIEMINALLQPLAHIIAKFSQYAFWDSYLYTCNISVTLLQLVMQTDRLTVTEF